MKKNILIVIIPLLVFVSLMVVGCTNTKDKKDDSESTVIIAYKGIDITPGIEFRSESINEKAEYLELESCAFEGNDKVYKYQSIEITTSAISGKETVYSAYFLNDTIQTIEGVKISDEKALMIEKYGENYEHINNEYKYIKSGVALSFIIENDIIISIEYIYNSGNI